LVYRNVNFKIFIYDDLATSCKNLVNFGPVTPEFTRVVGVYPLVDHQLLDLAGISTEFCGAIGAQLYFTTIR